MKGLTKKLLIIIASVIVVGIIAALPGFAETQDQLKQVFVTRKDVGKWVKYASYKMEWAESIANWKIYSECSKEMKARGVKDKNKDKLDPTPGKASEAYNPNDPRWTWP